MATAMGRKKLLLTPEQVSHVEKLAPMLKLSEIADFLGIHETTLRKRMEEDPEIHQAYKRGRAKAIGDVAGTLLRKARDGNIAAMIFYLKTQARWREVHRVENINVSDALSDEELEAIIRGDE